MGQRGPTGRGGSLLRQVLLTASRSHGVRKIVETAPYTRGVVRRFIAGTAVDDALRVTERLTAEGLLVTLDPLGEDTLDPGQAAAIIKNYETLLERLGTAGLGARAEVSVKLTALGQLLDDGEAMALANARRICSAARSAGTAV